SPNGCAQKYLENGDRLQAEIQRSVEKVEQRQQEKRAQREEERAQKAEAGAEINGAQLLNAVYEFLGRFVSYPTRHTQVTNALWVVHTHLMDAWDTTPRLAILSPEPGCGKSRVLEVMELLVPRPIMTINASPAYVIRKISSDDGLPTIL